MKTLGEYYQNDCFEATPSHFCDLPTAMPPVCATVTAPASGAPFEVRSIDPNELCVLNVQEHWGRFELIHQLTKYGRFGFESAPNRANPDRVDLVVTYSSFESTYLAFRELRHLYTPEGETLQVKLSFNEDQLYIRNMPKIDPDEAYNVLCGVFGRDACGVSISKGSSVDEAFCHVKFRDYESAHAAISQFGDGQLVLWGRRLYLEWTTPDSFLCPEEVRDFEAELRIKCTVNKWEQPTIVFGRIDFENQTQHMMVILKSSTVQSMILFEMDAGLDNLNSRCCEIVVHLIEALKGLPRRCFVIKANADFATIAGFIEITDRNQPIMYHPSAATNPFKNLDEICDLACAGVFLLSHETEIVLDRYERVLYKQANVPGAEMKFQSGHLEGAPLINIGFVSEMQFLNFHLPNGRHFGCAVPYHGCALNDKLLLSIRRMTLVLCDLVTKSNYPVQGEKESSDLKSLHTVEMMFAEDPNFELILMRLLPASNNIVQNPYPSVPPATEYAQPMAAGNQEPINVQTPPQNGFQNGFLNPTAKEFEQAAPCYAPMPHSPPGHAQGPNTVQNGFLNPTANGLEQVAPEYAAMQHSPLGHPQVPLTVQNGIMNPSANGFEQGAPGYAPMQLSSPGHAQGPHTVQNDFLHPSANGFEQAAPGYAPTQLSPPPGHPHGPHTVQNGFLHPSANVFEQVAPEYAAMQHSPLGHAQAPLTVQNGIMNPSANGLAQAAPGYAPMQLSSPGHAQGPHTVQNDFLHPSANGFEQGAPGYAPMQLSPSGFTQMNRVPPAPGFIPAQNMQQNRPMGRPMCRQMVPPPQEFAQRPNPPPFQRDFNNQVIRPGQRMPPRSNGYMTAPANGYEMEQRRQSMAGYANGHGQPPMQPQPTTVSSFGRDYQVIAPPPGRFGNQQAHFKQQQQQQRQPYSHRQRHRGGKKPRG